MRWEGRAIVPSWPTLWANHLRANPDQKVIAAVGYGQITRGGPINHAVVIYGAENNPVTQLVEYKVWDPYLCKKLSIPAHELNLDVGNSWLVKPSPDGVPPNPEEAPMAQAITIHDETLSAAEFGCLLDHFKASVPSSSPLADIGRKKADRTAMQALQDRGLLDRDGGAAIGLLASGAPGIAIELAALDSIERSYFFADAQIARHPLGLLVRKKSDGSYRLLFPLGLPDLLRHLMDPLDPVGTAPPVWFDRKLTAGGLMALAACVDFLRTLFAASIIERRGVDHIIVRRADLDEQLRIGLVSSDHRSLVSLLKALLPAAIPAEPDAVARGLQELTSASLLIEVDPATRAMTPHPELIHLAFNLMSSIPAISLSRNGSKPASLPQRLIVIRGASLWHLEPDESGTALALRLRCVDGLTSLSDALDFLKGGADGEEHVEDEAPAKSAVPRQLCMRLSTGRTLALVAGARLGAPDLFGLGDGTSEGVFAEVAVNPNDPTVLGLKNLSRLAWPAATPGGEDRTLEPGRSLKLAHGTQIRFGSMTGLVRQDADGFALQLGKLPAIRLTKGLRLTAAGGLGMPHAATQAAALEVVRNPQDPSALGLKNLTGHAWTATTPGGEPRTVEPGRSIRLAVGTKIDFGVVRGDIGTQAH
jgi:hypothetical protein